MNKKNYFIISFFITCILMFINKKIIFQKFHNSDTIRELYTDVSKDYSCEKAGSRLMDKYNGGYDEEMGEPTEKLNEAEQSIVDFARHSSYSNIKPYLKRTGIYIAFLCLAILFIFFWISYCSCCCCSCCLFSKVDKTPRTLQTIFWIIGAVTNLLVIIFSIIVLCLISPFFSRLNGLFCSSLILLDHLNYGLSPHYPPYSNTWVGLGGVSQKFNDSATAVNSIDNDKMGDLFTEALGVCSNSDFIDSTAITDDTCICTDNELTEDLEFYNSLYELVKSFNLLGEVTKYLDSKKIIDESRIDADNDIYDFLHDYANSHIKRLCIGIFTLTLVFGVLGIAFLSLYYFIKREIYRIIYIIIWNISMLISILAVIISAIYGVIGYVFTDLVQVLNYSLSQDNLLSDDPIIFTRKDDFLHSIIDECANGDGHLFDIVSEEIESINFGITLAFQLKMLEVNESCDDEEKEIILNFYQTMLNNTDILLSNTQELFNISCAFAKNDKYIILNEIESAGKRATVISTFQFLIGILLAISILVGILFVHKYIYKIDSNVSLTNVTVNSNPKENPNNQSKSFEYING